MIPTIFNDGTEYEVCTPSGTKIMRGDTICKWMDKRIPVLPKVDRYYDGSPRIVCPHCGTGVTSKAKLYTTDIISKFKYCCNCGQHIGWSD